MQLSPLKASDWWSSQEPNRNPARLIKARRNSWKKNIIQVPKFPQFYYVWEKNPLNIPKSQCITNWNMPNDFLQNQHIDPNLAKLALTKQLLSKNYKKKNTRAPGNAYNPDKMYYNGSITHALTYIHAYFVLLQYNTLCVAPRTPIT